MDELSDDDLKMVLEVSADVDPLKADLAQVAEQVDEISDAGMERMTKALASQKVQLRDINALLGPQASMIRDQVRGELELVDANRRLAELRAAETLSVRGHREAGAPLPIPTPVQATPRVELAGQPDALRIAHPGFEVGKPPPVEVQPSPVVPVEEPRKQARSSIFGRERQPTEEPTPPTSILGRERRPAEVPSPETTLVGQSAAVEIAHPDVEVGAPAPVSVPAPPVTVRAPPAQQLQAPAISARDMLAQVNALDQQRDAVARINAALDPDVLRTRVQLTHEETQARAALQVASITQETDPARIRERLEVEQKITQARERYKAVEDQIRTSMSEPVPEKAAKPVWDAGDDGERRTKAVVDLQKQLTDQIEQQRLAQAQIAAMSDPAVTGLQAQLDRQQGITAEQQHQAELARIRDSMEPQAMANAVRRQRELTEAREAYNRALKDEQADQLDPKSVVDAVTKLGQATASIDSARERFAEGLETAGGDAMKRLSQFTVPRLETPAESAATTRPLPTAPTRQPVGGGLPEVTQTRQPIPVNNERRSGTQQQAVTQGATGQYRTAANAEQSAEADKSHKEKLSAITDAMDPAVVAETVRREMELTTAQKQYNEALEQARAKAEGAAAGWNLAGKAMTAASLVVRGIVAGIGVLDSALRGLQGPLGPIGVGLGMLESGLNKVAPALDRMLPGLGAIAGGAANAVGGITSILGTLTHFSALAAPGMMEQFSIALQDVMGVIGGTALPVMELLRDGIRLFGDVLANILPNADEVRQALSAVTEAFGPLRDAVMEMMAEIGPSIRQVFVELIGMAAEQLRVIMDVLRELMPSLQELFMGLKDVFDALKPLRAMLMEGFKLAVQGLVTALKVVVAGLNAFIDLLRLVGLVGQTTAGRGDPRSSVGAASRSAQFEGVEQYQQRLQLAALQQPGAITQEQLPTMVNSISTTLTSIWQYIQNFTLVGLGRAIRDAITPGAPAPTAAQQAANAAAGAGANVLAGGGNNMGGGDF